MESKQDIVNILAKERRVETMIQSIAHQSLSADLEDLSQMVYLILIEYDEAKMQDLWSHNQINFFIARIITNQYRSSSSPFYAVFRKFRAMINEDVRFEDSDFEDNGNYTHKVLKYDK